jgi:microcystin degradation protein MlrC
MRIGIIALLHESNTFSSQRTTMESFRENLLLRGESIRDALADAHHEVGGFFAGLENESAIAVPLFAARALPSGTVTAAAFDELCEQVLGSVASAGSLDGILVAPHGATVSEAWPDADGRWLQQLREFVGPQMPIIGTLDAHANLSATMVESCDALIAYRTNPHLDQRARGVEAAQLIAKTVRGEVRPVMSARFPPLLISIECQCTNEPHLKPLYEFADQQLADPGVLSNSILLGFPYSDVAEMGSSVIAVTNDDQPLADLCAGDLARTMWNRRDQLHGAFVSIAEALDQARNTSGPVCLLDMGDNVGGGSSADGTELIAAIHAQRIGPSFGCLFDKQAVAICNQAGIGQQVSLAVGGKTDALHGSPLQVELTVDSLHDGQFQESQPRHGGISKFDQGLTAICSTESGLTLMLTSRRMVPFSLEQLRSCGLNPAGFRYLVAKGVNAPIAAYAEVCNTFLRVNTRGSTSADTRQLEYRHRRQPLYPIETNVEFGD